MDDIAINITDNLRLRVYFGKHSDYVYCLLESRYNNGWGSANIFSTDIKVRTSEFPGLVKAFSRLEKVLILK